MDNVTITTHRLRCFDPHGSHEIAYTHWGDTQNPEVLLCLHGLTRNGRDFDSLATQLAPAYQIICPDMAGRGLSDWLSHAEDYDYPLYIIDILNVLKHLHINTLNIIGTSMGGLIGMFLAVRYPRRIQRLVINDIGAVIPQTALQRIAQYLNQDSPHFADLAEVEQYLRYIYLAFGPLTDAQWQHLARHSVKPAVGGGYHLAHDPAIAYNFQKNSDQDVTLWAQWEAIHCPVLLLHGELSDLLLPETIQHMQATQPSLQTHTFPGIGHAPVLMDMEQIQIIQRWLSTV